MLTNITKLDDGTYVLRREVENTGDDDADLEAEAQMMKCGTANACSL